MPTHCVTRCDVSALTQIQTPLAHFCFSNSFSIPPQLLNILTPHHDPQEALKPQATGNQNSTAVRHTAFVLFFALHAAEASAWNHYL